MTVKGKWGKYKTLKEYPNKIKFGERSLAVPGNGIN